MVRPRACSSCSGGGLCPAGDAVSGFAADDADTISRRLAELAKEREENRCTCLYENGTLVAASATCPVHGTVVDEISGAVCGLGAGTGPSCTCFAHFDGYGLRWMKYERDCPYHRAIFDALEEAGYRLTGKQR